MPYATLAQRKRRAPDNAALMPYALRTKEETGALASPATGLKNNNKNKKICTPAVAHVEPRLGRTVWRRGDFCRFGGKEKQEAYR